MNSEYFRSRGAFRYVGVKGLLPQYESDLDGNDDNVVMMMMMMMMILMMMTTTMMMMM